MNRLEGTIFLCGVGILALTGCTQPEPITDDSIYVGGKIGTIYVDTPEWAPRKELEDCEVLLADGRIVHREGYCDDSAAAKKPKKPLDPSNKKGNNGWGNGDQTAPGKSLHKNHAENKKNHSHRKHGLANHN